MDNKYKVILSNKRIYKEIDIPSDKSTIRIGTKSTCDFRIRRDMFFEDIELVLINDKGNWAVACPDNIYLSSGDVRKLLSKKLSHGEELSICYAKTDIEALQFTFLLDFEYEEKRYDRCIDIRGLREISIGGVFDCNVLLSNQYITDDKIILTQNENSCKLSIVKASYGIYINGIKCEDGATIENKDFVSIANYYFYYDGGMLYTEASEDIVCNGVGFKDKANESTYPKFNRNTRLRTKVDERDIDVLNPPAKPQKPKTNIVLQLLPALGMIAVVVVVRGFIGSGGGSSFILFSVCSMGIGIVTSIATMISDKKQYKKDIIEREEKYKNYVENKKQEITELREKERKTLKEIHISTNEELDNVFKFSGDIFDKSTDDEDFLSVHIGDGDVKARRKIKIKEQEEFATDDELILMPAEVADEFTLVKDAPVVINCKEDGVIGVIGGEQEAYDFVKNITVDICARHYYKDVNIAIFIRPEDEKLFSWIKWIPHLQNEHTGMRNVVCNEESKNSFFEHLYIELSKRSAMKDVSGTVHYVVMILEDWGIKTHPVSQFINRASELNVSFIFFETQKRDLPMFCKEIIKLSNGGENNVIESEDKSVVQSFAYSTLSDKLLRAMSIKMAPIFCEEINLENSLTKSISLFEMMGILSPEDIDLKKNWATAQIHKTMAAPLGVKTKNEMVYLDLHEKAHGPHGLVAGTTGSGKSEILQSYVLSMATLFHPYEVGFVIIDFKGGGMANQFENLPHMMGTITNIDGKEIQRSLLSIKAELQKRQRLFAEAGVNSINNYINKYKNGEVITPLPHLIVIVDEFAELKAEQPEFMKELISAARIGRSLGVHLILATQKPSGQVNEQIWSNSRFKLCLKVQTKEDSNEVLKSPLAAEIREPGRAYLQVGNNEIFELFQSAYSGAPARFDDSINVREFAVSEIDFSGKRREVFRQKKNQSKESTETQLEAIVNYVDQYCKDQNIQLLPDICLPPLPDIIQYKTRRIIEGSNEISAQIGIYDDPNNQAQKEVQLGISTGNTLIVGSALYGKTNLIQLIIRTLSESYDPRQISFYIFDFGSMALKVFDRMNNVGGVVTANDDEKVKNFFKLINREADKRKRKFSELGITSFQAYQEAGYDDMPQIVLCIDNIIVFKELFNDYEDEFLSILRDGISLGISVIATANQTSGIGYKYMNNFANRICLFCHQSDEYSSVLDRCHIVPKETAGRGVVKLHKNIYEFQSYLAFEGEREIDRVVEIQKFIEQYNSRYPDMCATGIPEVPGNIDRSFIDRVYEDTVPYTIPIGIDYEEVEVVTIDLQKSNLISITGREKSGKTNLLYLIMDYFKKNIFDYPAKIYLIDDYSRRLRQFSEYGFVERYTTDINEFEIVLEEIERILQIRKKQIQSNGIEWLENEDMIICIIENRNIFLADGLSQQAIARFKQLVSDASNMKVCFLFSSVPNVGISYNSPEMLKHVKDSDILIMMDDIKGIKCIEVTASVARKYKKSIELGDAFMQLKDVELKKIKIVNAGR